MFAPLCWSRHQLPLVAGFVLCFCVCHKIKSRIVSTQNSAATVSAPAMFSSVCPAFSPCPPVDEFLQVLQCDTNNPLVYTHPFKCSALKQGQHPFAGKLPAALPPAACAFGLVFVSVFSLVFFGWMFTQGKKRAQLIAPDSCQLFRQLFV